MNGKLEFEEGGRSYACHVDATKGSRTSSWWWFSVSGDANRYAPFRAEPGDTADSVRARVVEYYLNHLTRRSMPTEARPGWGRRPGTQGVARS